MLGIIYLQIYIKLDWYQLTREVALTLSWVTFVMQYFSYCNSLYNGKVGLYSNGNFGHGIFTHYHIILIESFVKLLSFQEMFV